MQHRGVCAGPCCFLGSGARRPERHMPRVLIQGSAALVWPMVPWASVPGRGLLLRECRWQTPLSPHGCWGAARTRAQGPTDSPQRSHDTMAPPALTARLVRRRPQVGIRRNRGPGLRQPARLLCTSESPGSLGLQVCTARGQRLLEGSRSCELCSMTCPVPKEQRRVGPKPVCGLCARWQDMAARPLGGPLWGLPPLAGQGVPFCGQCS